MNVTYDKGRQVAPVDPALAEIKFTLDDIRKRQVRIETRLCVLTTALGYSAQLEARFPPYEQKTL